MEPTYSNSNSKGNSKVVGVGVLIVILAAGLGYIFVTSPKKDQTIGTPVVVTTDTSGQTTGTPAIPTISVTSVQTPTQTPTTPTTPVSSSVYKNGTYTATGSYNSPAGMEQLSVTVTLSNDVITSSTVVAEAGDGTSRRYQNMFIAGYKPYVIGKKISSVNLDTVSGSSLTPQGFNNALSQIESQAKA